MIQTENVHEGCVSRKELLRFLQETKPRTEETGFPKEPNCVCTLKTTCIYHTDRGTNAFKVLNGIPLEETEKEGASFSGRGFSCECECCEPPTSMTPEQVDVALLENYSGPKENTTPQSREQGGESFHVCPQDESGLCDDCPCHQTNQ